MAKELENLRTRCNEIHEERRNAVISELEKWLESFISEKHRPWRAVEGNKKCRPIPIHNDFTWDRLRNLNLSHPPMFSWPDLPDEEIISIIKDLGFEVCSINPIVLLNEICLYVPQRKDAEPLTFAQEWVKKINDAYSEYVCTQKKIAIHTYKEILEELSKYPISEIRCDDGYVIFENYQYPEHISRECYLKVTNLLSKDGITFHHNEEENFAEVHVSMQPK